MDKVEFPDVRGVHETAGGALIVKIEECTYAIPMSLIDEDSEVYQKGSVGTLILPEWWVDKQFDLSELVKKRSSLRVEWRYIQFTQKQRGVVDRAVANVRERVANSTTDGKCVAIACSVYLDLWQAVEATLGEGAAKECLDEWRKNS
jgi:hypothetical protein